MKTLATEKLRIDSVDTTGVYAYPFRGGDGVSLSFAVLVEDDKHPFSTVVPGEIWEVSLTNDGNTEGHHSAYVMSAKVNKLMRVGNHDMIEVELTGSSADAGALTGYLQMDVDDFKHVKVGMSAFVHLVRSFEPQ